MSSATETRSSSTTTPVGSGSLTPTQISEKIELVRGRLGDPTMKLTKELVLVASTELQSLYKKLLMSDLENGIQRQVENFMWTDCFKTPLTFFMKHDKMLFHWMIEAGVGFYLGFIQDIGIHFDVPFIRNSVRNLYCTPPKSKSTWKFIPSKSAVYYIIQNSMVHVGDLLRYRGSFVEAIKMYEKSTSVCPSNGHPYNQMGLVQLQIDSKSIESLLSGIYYYVRAVGVSNPFLPAQENLVNLLGKVKTTIPKNKEEEFVHSFLVGIGDLNSSFSTTTTSTYTFSLTEIVLKKSLTFHHLFRILVIALWAWHREMNKSILGIEYNTQENNALEIIVALFNGLVAGLLEFPELATARYMPHLKICIDWLRLHPKIMRNEVFSAKFDVPTLCRLVNRLVPTETTFTETAKDLNLVILPEEKKLLGFLPFAKAFDHLQSAFDELDPRHYSLRTGRFLQAMDVLADCKPQFMERNVLTKEYKPLRTPITIATFRSPFPAPSRRNVALHNIFSQMVSPPTPAPLPATSPPEDTTELDLTPPLSQRSVKSTIGDGRRSRQSPPSYYFQGQSNPPTPSLDPFALPLAAGQRENSLLGPDVSSELNNDSSTSLFTSIWTPFSEKTPEGGWK